MGEMGVTIDGGKVRWIFSLQDTLLEKNMFNLEKGYLKNLFSVCFCFCQLW